MGKAEKAAGARGERLCRDLCRLVWPGAYCPGQQMPVKEPDVARTDFWIESKWSKARSGLRPWSALDQALADKARLFDPRPVLVYLKASRQPAVVMMLAEDWIKREQRLAALEAERDPLKGGGVW